MKNVADKLFKGNYEPYILKEDQLSFYKENGYLVIPNFISSEECKKLEDAAFEYAGDKIHNHLNFHREIDEFRNLILHPQLHDICDQLQDFRMIPIGSIFFFGKPNNRLENGSLPHQDNYAAKAPSGSYFVTALALDDADETNGALTVYPGSHKLGELPFTETKNFEYDNEGNLIANYPIGNEVEIPQGYKKEILNYKKGSLILMHTDTIHSADKNTNNEGRWRKKIYMHFIKEGDPFWPGWNARRQIMDRGPRRT
jgi:ectoine hydroxylase-related dioxygenase (phytanoyl-CoA dioxygenase family)